VDRERVANDLVALDLAHERRKEDVLVVDAGNIGTATHAVTGTKESLGELTLQCVCSRLQEEPDLAVTNRLRHAHVNAADGVGHLDDTTHLHLRGEFDVDASEVLDRRNDTSKPTA